MSAKCARSQVKKQVDIRLLFATQENMLKPKQQSINTLYSTNIFFKKADAALCQVLDYLVSSLIHYIPKPGT